MDNKKILIGGQWTSTARTIDVINPYNRRLVARVCAAGEREVDAAIRAAKKAFETARYMPGHKTADILRKTAAGILKNRDRLARAIVAEAGKPVTYALQEVDRSVVTFETAAQEATRMDGELLPIDADPRGEGRYCLVKRFPVGVVAGISPFNFPLNLVAHKVAPAIASRNTIVLKPSSKTPVTALMLGEILMEAGLPAGQYNVVPCSRELGEKLATDNRVSKVTFTGSPPVGWRLKEICGRKKITLELGGNAAAVICADADLKWAIPRIVAGAFGYAGQTCISVQRILIEGSIYEKALRALVKETKEKAKTGDPLKPEVMTGPMIDETAMAKTVALVRQAVKGGAKVLTGGKKQGACYMPTLLADVRDDMGVVCQEAFAPLAVIQKFTTFSQAVNMVNNSPYGLQAGIFTSDMGKAFTAFEKLEVGGVIVNDFPNFRVDNMPYGGVKLSGFGREGVKYAIEEMTERKVLVIKP
ncbi:MAG: aldehyde dehydrogenase family protein [Nitrospinae bacterium]|nr:aldehyde dehydrogenase family protein [Nitrospinota bacterium]